MKITGYNASVNGVGMPSATVKAVGDMMAHGGNGDGYKAISKALGQVQLEYERMAEEEDKRALMSAMDTYNKGRYNILYDDENGVMNTKLAGAAGSVMAYQEREQKLRNEIAGNLKFKTKKYQLVFDDMVNKSAQQGYQLVDRHEYQEGEKQQDVVLNNNLNNEIQFAQKNPDNDSFIMQAVSRGTQLISARYAERGEEFVKQMANQYEAKLASGIIDNAIMRGEYDRAEYIKDAFNAVFTPEQRSAIEKRIFDKQEYEYTMKLAESLYGRHGEDLDTAMKELEDTAAFGSNRTMNFIERKNVLDMLGSIINTNKAIERAEANRIFKGASETVTEMINNFTPYTKAMEWAEQQAGGDIKQLNALRRTVNIHYKNLDSKDVKLGDNGMAVINQMIGAGRFNTIFDLEEFAVSQGANSKELQELSKKYDDYVNAAGEFKFDWKGLLDSMVKESKLKGPQKEVYEMGLRAVGRNFIRDYRDKHDGADPDIEDLKDVLKEASTSKVYGGKYTGWTPESDWLGYSNLEYNSVELAGRGIKELRMVDEDLYIIKDVNNTERFVNGATVRMIMSGGM